METLIRQYREAAGLTLAALARKAQVDQSHLWKVENGKRRLQMNMAVALAEALDIKPTDLWKELNTVTGPDGGDHVLFAAHAYPGATKETSLATIPEMNDPNDNGDTDNDYDNVTILEPDMRRAIGDLAAYSDDRNRARIVARWQVPRDWVEQIPSPDGRDLYIFRVIGNSMAPDFPAKSRVLVNAADRLPSPPGPFVIYDGMSFVIKLVSYNRNSSPPTVTISSRDPAYPAEIVPLSELHIQGRVVGRWEWT